MNINPNNQIFNVVFDICNIYKNDFTSFFNLNCGSESLFLNNKFDCNEDDNCFLFDKNSVLVGDSKNELLSKCSNIKGLYGNIIEDWNELTSNLEGKIDFTCSFSDENKDKFFLNKKHTDKRFSKNNKYVDLDTAITQSSLQLLNDDGVYVGIFSLNYLSKINSKSYREDWIKQDLVEAVISFPTILDKTFKTPLCLIIFNKNKKTENKGKTLFIDTTELIEKIGKYNLFDEKQILEIYKTNSTINNVSRVLSIEGISAEDFNLTPSRYVINKTELDFIQFLNSKKKFTLESVCEKILNVQNFSENINGVKVPFLNTEDLKDMDYITNFNNVKRIDIDTNKNKISNFKLKQNDILISCRGDIGEVGIIGNLGENLLLPSSNMILVRFKDNINELWIKSVYMFLKSDIGQFLIKRTAFGNNLSTISTNDIKKLGIPLFDKNELETLNSRFEEITKFEKQISLLNNEIKKRKKLL